MGYITAKYCAERKKPTKVYLSNQNPTWSPFRDNAQQYTEQDAKQIIQQLETKTHMQELKYENQN